MVCYVLPQAELLGYQRHILDLELRLHSTDICSKLGRGGNAGSTTGSTTITSTACGAPLALITTKSPLKDVSANAKTAASGGQILAEQLQDLSGKYDRDVGALQYAMSELSGTLQLSEARCQALQDELEEEKATTGNLQRQHQVPYISAACPS